MAVIMIWAQILPWLSTDLINLMSQGPHLRTLLPADQTLKIDLYLISSTRKNLGTKIGTMNLNSRTLKIRS
jgi:hypothetical protein